MAKCFFLHLVGLFFFLSGQAQDADDTLNPSQMQQEISIIRSAWQSLHPGLYRFISPPEMSRIFNAAQNAAALPLSKRSYFVLLSQLATAIRCGHTYPNPWNQPRTVRQAVFSDRVLPFLFKVIEGRLIITHNLSSDPTIRPGDEITRINCIPAAAIRDSLLTVSRADGRHGLAKKLDNISISPQDIDTTNFAFFDIYFPLFFRGNFSVEGYQVEIKSYQKIARTVYVPTLSKIQRQQAYIARFGEIPLHEKNWSFRFLGTHTALLRLGDFETWEWKRDYKEYLDSIFQAIRQSPATRLIIDIRGNEGGDDDARNLVLSYILKKPFGCEDVMRRLYKFLSIPDTLKPYLTTWNKTFLRPKKATDFIQTTDGYYETRDTTHAPCIPFEPKPGGFKGQVFLLTDSRNRDRKSVV